jgi:hypothetical protein
MKSSKYLIRPKARLAHLAEEIDQFGSRKAR